MSLVDNSYFKADLFIPGLEKKTQNDLLCQFINKYEPDMLQRALGDNFYILFRDALNTNTPAQRWIDLRDGKEYTIDGKKMIWGNIRNPIAGYVYYHFQRDAVTASTIVGETSENATNSTRVSPDRKMTKAWNDAMDQLCEMWYFLISYKDDAGTLIFPEFDIRCVNVDQFNPINFFNV